LGVGWGLAFNFVQCWQYLDFAKPKQEVKICYFITLQEMRLAMLYTDQEYAGMEWVATWPQHMWDESR